MSKVIIIGGGFAGLAAAKRLCASVEARAVTLIDKKKTSDFLPLLPDIIGRGIAPYFVNARIEDANRSGEFSFIEEQVLEADLENKQIATAQGKIPYDYLLIASGSETNFYGNEIIRRHAYTLDDVNDAQFILEAVKNKGLRTFVVAGGGYTGIEMATHLRMLLRRLGRTGRVIIAERAPAILGPLPQWMKDYVRQSLKDLGIEVYLNSTVEKIDGSSVRISGGIHLEGAMVVWVAGVKTAGFIQKMSSEKNPQGRLKVDEFLRVNESCFAAGDASYFSDKGNFLRMSVQFAITQGKCAAENIIRSMEGKKLRPYKPFDFGYIIPMADDRACGRVLDIDMKGCLPVFLHFFMCIFRSRSFRNQKGILVSLLDKGGYMADIAAVVLRLGLGIMFAAHGAQKAFGVWQGAGISGFTNMLSSLGFAPAAFWAYLVACVELIGGICLILGLLTRISAALLLIVMMVAAAKVHLAKGFFLSGGGFEYVFIIACACLALMLMGGGKFSLWKKL